MGMKYLYPKTHFDLTVVADQLEPSTEEKLVQLGANVHRVCFDKSTKVKSLQSVNLSESDFEKNE